MVANIDLRIYQEKSIVDIDDHFRRGNRRIILWAQTGSGKTTIAAWMIKRALEYKYPVIFVVRGRELVKNASETLDKYGIDHSINMAGHWRYNSRKLIQVCSMDTLKSRENYPFRDQEPLIFLDEMHRNYDDMFDVYQGGFFIGMSATPFSDNSKYHSYVKPLEGYELRDQGYLVPDKFYCPHIIDVSAVKIKAGDFEKKQLESVVTQSAVVGNVVSDWKKLGENRPTVCFAVSVEHSLQLKQAFVDAGIPAVHCDAKSSDKERKDAKDGILSGKIKVICNVDIFSTGWDAPPVSCIILARPTWSKVWFYQAIGRGLRPSEGKTNCIILDNAGNVFRHGTAYKVHEISLEKPEKKKARKMDNRVSTCEECFYVYDPEEFNSCPECGFERPGKSREVKTINGTLVEYFETEEEQNQHLFKMMRADYYKLEWVRKTKKLNENWVFQNLRKKYPTVFHELVKVTAVPAIYLKDLPA